MPFWLGFMLCSPPTPPTPPPTPPTPPSLTRYNAKESSVKLKYAPQPTPRPIQGPLASKTVARVACGAQHTLALTADGCAYTWGNGGYGRLGHNVQQDEFSPRLVEGLTGRTPVDPALPCAAGSTASYCSSHGQVREREGGGGDGGGGVKGWVRHPTKYPMI